MFLNFYHAVGVKNKGYFLRLAFWPQSRNNGQETVDFKRVIRYIAGVKKRSVSRSFFSATTYTSLQYLGTYI